ncbi:BTAD domain-containing putative transcriptional regulator [Streptomyces sp. NPDC087219]|uniref:AfsR/SARP family transcriptional regulator n=1 Tax=Streptomyces sp. NPDC087219 TaxID=3365770 RepID=UPI003829DA83
MEPGRRECQGARYMLGDARELLPDWEEEWLSGERERLRQLQLHLQESLAERLTSEGRFGLALEVALATLRLDVLRESAHRSVIRIHLAEGNIGEARRAYATCRQVLRQELASHRPRRRRACSPFPRTPAPDRRAHRELVATALARAVVRPRRPRAGSRRACASRRRRWSTSCSPRSA